MPPDSHNLRKETINSINVLRSKTTKNRNSFVLIRKQYILQEHPYLKHVLKSRTTQPHVFNAFTIKVPPYSAPDNT